VLTSREKVSRWRSLPIVLDDTFGFAGTWVRTQAFNKFHAERSTKRSFKTTSNNTQSQSPTN
jgi:hypothetical protein